MIFIKFHPWLNFNSTSLFEIFRAVQGCAYILHIASPWPIVADENTIEIAKNGTLNVLNAAAQCSTIKKIVLTSSTAAINGKIFWKEFNRELIYRIEQLIII